MKLVDRVKAILLTPRTEWPVITQEQATMSDLFLKYVAILAAIPEVAHLIGQSLIGAAREPILTSLLRAPHRLRRELGHGLHHRRCASIFLRRNSAAPGISRAR